MTNQDWEKEFSKSFLNPKNTGYRVGQEFLGAIMEFIRSLLKIECEKARELGYVERGTLNGTLLSEAIKQERNWVLDQIIIDFAGVSEPQSIEWCAETEKEFINKLLETERNRVLDEVRLEKMDMKQAIKYNSDAGAGHVIGYNSAISDLEELKNKLREI